MCPHPPAKREASPPTREKILEMGEPLFGRDGFAGVGMRAVADAVGIGKSSLFHHFASKLALYFAVLERSLLAIEADIAAVEARPADPLGELRAWVAAVIESLAVHPPRARLLLRSLLEAQIQAVEPEYAESTDRIIERILARVAIQLEAGIAAGQLRDTSIPHTIQSLIGMTVYHFASGEFGDELLGRPVFSAVEVRRRVDHVVAFLDGLAVAP